MESHDRPQESDSPPQRRARKEGEEDAVIQSSDNLATVGNDAEKPPPANLEWATTIKNRHVQIRERAKELQSVDAAWAEATQDESGLVEYSTAMHHLATKYWQSSAGSRYDDRILYALHCLQEYFVGEVTEAVVDDEEGTETETAVSPGQFLASNSRVKAMPMILRGKVKERRREHFHANNETHMTEAEVAAVADDILQPSGQSTSALATARRLMQHLVKPSSPALTVLDVGSCYNPFNGAQVWPELQPPVEGAASQTSAGGVRCDVVAVDLGPYPGSGVLKCDWLAAKFEDKATAEALQQRAATAQSSSALVDAGPLPRGGFDAVIFSLLLSYMPTPEMRFRACLQAWRALRPDGLLIVISTRTQGSRAAGWINDWVAAIESIGFKRVHKNLRHKLVGLSFRKVVGGAENEGGEAWEKQLMASSTASQLTIIADAI